MAVEEDTKTDEHAIPEWAAGYALILPCDKKTPSCDQEAEWFANQHGCIRAHLCDEHMQECYRDVVGKLNEWGSVRCTVCKRFFQTFDAFIKAVRI